jgi:hypothetical protein
MGRYRALGAQTKSLTAMLLRCLNKFKSMIVIVISVPEVK